MDFSLDCRIIMRDQIWTPELAPFLTASCCIVFIDVRLYSLTKLTTMNLRIISLHAQRKQAENVGSNDEKKRKKMRRPNAVLVLHWIITNHRQTMVLNWIEGFSVGTLVEFVLVRIFARSCFWSCFRAAHREHRRTTSCVTCCSASNTLPTTFTR